MSPERPDEEIVSCIQSGDQSALEILILRYQKQIFNYLYKLSRNYELSEDITQETFVKLYYNINKVTAGATVKSLLFTIARNTFIDRTRKRSVKEVSLTKDHEDISAKTHGNDATFDKVLSSLSEKEQSIAILFFKYKFTHKELAETLGIPIGTVKSSLHAVVNKLRSRSSEKL